MNRDPREQKLLEHYRRHSDEQPSAQLDARILAAARAAVQESKPSLGARLHHWLLGGGSRQRWGVAVAGLATLGIGLSLALRTYDEAPQRFDAPVVPAMMRAPAPAPAMAPPAAPAAAPHVAAPKMESAPAGAFMGEVAKPAESAEFSKKRLASAAQQAQVNSLEQSQAMADAAPEEPRSSLLHLRTLQREGQSEAAARVRESLHQRFPDLDIDKALQDLPEGL